MSKAERTRARNAGDRVRQRGVVPVLRGRALGADRRAFPLRHLEPPRHDQVLVHRRLSRHRHPLVPRRDLPQRAAHAPDPPSWPPAPAAPCRRRPRSTPASSAHTTSRRTSTAPASPGRSRSWTSATATSWPARSTTRRYSPGCPPPRSPPSCGIPQPRWPRRSTGPPGSSSPPSPACCTTQPAVGQADARVSARIRLTVSASVLACGITRSRTEPSRSRGRYQPRMSSGPNSAACGRVAWRRSDVLRYPGQAPPAGRS